MRRFTTLDVLVEGVKERHMSLFEGDRWIARVGVKAEGRTFAEMRQLFVDEPFRWKGHGSTLVAECRAFAIAHGCLSLAITVAQCNRQVIPFYSKLGFLPCYQFADGEIVMALPLRGNGGDA